jgi:hypothetical protein
MKSASERKIHGVSFSGIKDFTSQNSIAINRLSAGLEDEVSEAANSLHQMAVVRDQLKSPSKEQTCKSSRKEEPTSRTSLAKCTDDDILIMSESNDTAGEISKVKERVKDDKRIAIGRRSMMAFVDDSTMIPLNTEKMITEKKYMLSGNEKNELRSIIVLPKKTDRTRHVISRKSDVLTDSDCIDDSTKAAVDTEKRISGEYSATLGGSIWDEKRIAADTMSDNLFIDDTSEKRTGEKKFMSTSPISSLFPSEEDPGSKLPSPKLQKIGFAANSPSGSPSDETRKKNIADEEKDVILDVIDSNSDVSNTSLIITNAEKNDIDLVKEDVGKQQAWVRALSSRSKGRAWTDKS